MSWSDRSDDPLPSQHPERGRRRAPSAGLLASRFWREAADRAVKSSAQALIIYWGGETLHAWQVNWATSVRLAVGAAVLSVATSVASAPLGNPDSASVIRQRP